MSHVAVNVRRGITVNLRDLDDLPVTVSVERAAALLGIGRGLAYQLARRGDFPVATLKLGRRLLVPTAALMRLLGLDPPAPSVVPSTPGTPVQCA